MAMTLDGKVMRPDGSWHGLTSSYDRKTMDEYRSRAQALIVGRNSVEKDNPVFALKDGRPGPRPVMICRSRLPVSNLRFFQHNPLLYVTPDLADSEAQPIQNLCEIISLDNPSPAAVLSDLFQKGYTSVLLEGGPGLNAGFFFEDLVDCLYLTIVPFILGDSSLPGIVDSDRCIPDFENRNWKLERCEKMGNEVFTEYSRQRN
tara:strand:- start:21737 stop:22345 length:609 start_codon:yes stop_codon:yes gene_type:complete